MNLTYPTNRAMLQEDVQQHGAHPEADLCVLPPRPPPQVEVPEDVRMEFTIPIALSRPREGPRVINVGIPGSHTCMHALKPLRFDYVIFYHL